MSCLQAAIIALSFTASLWHFIHKRTGLSHCFSNLCAIFKDFQTYRVGKLDALGKLAAGLVHDFNNILAIILGNLDLMEHSDDFVRDEPPEEDERLVAVRDACLDGQELVHQLSVLMRKTNCDTATHGFFNDRKRGFGTPFACYNFHGRSKGYDSTGKGEK